jgi:PGM1 C-terminal domain
VGNGLIGHGIEWGDYGVDFVALRHGIKWQLYGCEINLRATGLKHGFNMVTTLLGTRPAADGTLQVDGETRVYLATDAIANPRYVGLTPRMAIDAVRESKLHYDHSRKRGVVLHMLSALPAYGKLGAVCVASDLLEAQLMMRELTKRLEDAAG